MPPLFFPSRFGTSGIRFSRSDLVWVTGRKRNHGEDVQKEYFYLDSTPTHSYNEPVQYPQSESPTVARRGNRRRSRKEPEFRAGGHRRFSARTLFRRLHGVAKKSANDILIKITSHNRSADPGRCTCFRRVCEIRGTWGNPHEVGGQATIEQEWGLSVKIQHETLGTYRFEAKPK